MKTPEEVYAPSDRLYSPHNEGAYPKFGLGYVYVKPNGGMMGVRIEIGKVLRKQTLDV